MSTPAPARPPEEPTVTLLARRSTHYLYDRRTRTLVGREPVHAFPGVHETLVVHLAAVLPPWMLAHVSAERLAAVAWKPARALVLAASVGYRGLRGARRTVMTVVGLPRRAARRVLRRSAPASVGRKPSPDR